MDDADMFASVGIDRPAAGVREQRQIHELEDAWLEMGQLLFVQPQFRLIAAKQEAARGERDEGRIAQPDSAFVVGIHVVWSGTRAERRELRRHCCSELFQIGLRRLRQGRHGGEQSQQAGNKYRCNSTLHVSLESPCCELIWIALPRSNFAAAVWGGNFSNPWLQSFQRRD